MPFVSIIATPGEDHLRLLASDQPPAVAQPLTPAGTFGERPQLVVFQREVPDPAPVLARVHSALATSLVEPGGDRFDCTVPLAIRAIELAAAELWPPNRVRCPDCQHYFVAPIAESRRMYLACPHCHNPLLNPRWSSG